MQLAEAEGALAVPRRHVVERLVVRVLDPRAFDEGVEVPDVDEACAAAVRVRGDRARELVLPVLRVHVDHLTRLHVRAVLDGELAQAVR